MVDIRRPYKCTARIALPQPYAEHLKDVISVDREISDKVVKSFSILGHDGNDDDNDRGVVGDDDDGSGNDTMRVLQIIFEATDAKMLRVSISTTYDMINVALRCFQEFGG
ncbi:hypothetical protein ACHAW5_008000 [Stephanodiscus triporus]|uniref:Uncharacterized protein n=1 Tax=Stephanodiscus triporus TaxID=2934178 RepID=A0ABD3NAU7_9STRA